MAVKTSEEESAITDINVTPLVDVCLVLVIIFMVTANFIMQAGIRVSQSSSGAETGKVTQSENVNVILTKEGKIIINGREVKRGNLGIELQQAIFKSKDKMVTLVADKENRCFEVVDVLDIAKQNGAEKLSILKKIQEK
ncbi:MAG: biopolymer transporter ExbD [Candidatus Firestonebacteria bacterium]